jgi:AcrR family transcriptional regulator
MPRAGLTTERVIQLGADLADERGFAAVTLSAVAWRVDVRVASLYSHVAGSADLRAGIAQLALTELADEAASALAGRSGKDALSAFAGAYRRYARRHPGRYAAMRQPQEKGSPVVDAGRRHSELMRALLRGYSLEEPSQTHAARFLGSVLHGYASLELGGGFDHSSPTSDESWLQMLDAVDLTLRHWPT